MKKRSGSLMLLLSLAYLFMGCEFQPKLKKTDEKKYLALGDSYTVGESVPQEMSFPYLLHDSLEVYGFSLYPPIVVAKTGWTTDELKRGIENEAISGRFDLVTLLIGVNNQYRGRDTANYREEFQDLLLQAIQFAKQGAQGVLVISIPDWGVTPFANSRDGEKIAKEIDDFNAIAKSEAFLAGVHYIYITDISRTKYNGAYLIASDGLHPSGEMYAKWVEKIMPSAMGILKNATDDK